MPRLTLTVRIVLACGLCAALALLLFRSTTSLSCINAQRARSCSRILFIGNSYTFVNDLPHTFAALAKAGGHAVEVQMAAEGGWTLANHAGAPRTLEMLQSSKWDYVILQEQSQIPSIQPARNANMAPAARLLVQRIRSGGATPLLFLTWAHRDGWPEQGLNGYEPMQLQTTQGYLGIAQELGVGVAPVGEAWLAARREQPTLSLWQADGSHPAEEGTYLAACVFYAAMFRQSPVGLAYTADLPQATARALQTIAAQVVLNNPKRWHLP